jgi:hypothetical protein
MEARRRFPHRGYAGSGLIAIGWYLAWVRPDGFQFLWEHSFLLLWIGYNLVVDALNWSRTGTSLMTRNRAAYLGMFALSIPGWWLFEFLNLYVQNWHYVLNRPMGDFEYAVRTSIDFSVVIPSVLATAEWWGSSRFLAGSSRWKSIAVTRRRLAVYLLLGIGMLVAVITLPRYCFPLVWVSLFFIFDSLNSFLGTPSLSGFLERGNWRPVIALSLGALTCGFFWEMWNWNSLAHWEYSVPFVHRFQIFAMPLLGYAGYLPFGLECVAGAALVEEALLKGEGDSRQTRPMEKCS